jgi:choice-of-anchor A domain-containing protein
MSLVKSGVEGAVAAGGSVRVDDCSIGSRFTELRDVLVAEGVLDGTGSIIFGNAIYGETCGLTETAFENGGTSMHGHPIDFPMADAVLHSLCADIASLPADGTVLVTDDGIDLIGTDADSNVFDLGSGALGDGMAIYLSIPSGATAIVRVGGADAALRRMKIDVGGSKPGRVLWSLCDTESLALEGLTLPGTVLALHAAVHLSEATVHGAVIGLSLEGTVATQSAPFVGCVRDPDLPEP